MQKQHGLSEQFLRISIRGQDRHKSFIINLRRFDRLKETNLSTAPSFCKSSSGYSCFFPKDAFPDVAKSEACLEAVARKSAQDLQLGRTQSTDLVNFVSSTMIHNPGTKRAQFSCPIYHPFPIPKGRKGSNSWAVYCHICQREVTCPSVTFCLPSTFTNQNTMQTSDKQKSFIFCTGSAYSSDNRRIQNAKMQANAPEIS